MSGISKIYHVRQNDGLPPFYLLVSAEGGFPEVLVSRLKAGRVARLQDDEFLLAMADESDIAWIEPVRRDARLVVEELKGKPFDYDVLDSVGLMWRLEVVDFPGVYYGEDTACKLFTDIYESNDRAVFKLRRLLHKSRPKGLSPVIG